MTRKQETTTIKREKANQRHVQAEESVTNAGVPESAGA